MSNWSGLSDGAGTQAHGYSCALFNPGLANTFTLNLSDLTHPNAPLTTINLSAADLGTLKPKRTHTAFDSFLEKRFDGKWAGKVTYTYSKSKGNAEGQMNWDIGQGDVATTVLCDSPEFSVNASGLLPCGPAVGQRTASGTHLYPLRRRPTAITTPHRLCLTSARSPTTAVTAPTRTTSARGSLRRVDRPALSRPSSTWT